MTSAALRSDHGLSPAALSGEAILRALAARDQFEPFASQTEIAQVTGRAPKNIGRDLAQLQAAGLLLSGPSFVNWSHLAVSDDGHAAIAALDKAAGQGTAPDGDALVYVAPAQLDDNPLNPRKVYDQTKLEGMADTFEADRRYPDAPLTVSPVQANGRRFIFAGHRRKRAALITEARFAARAETLPHGLERGLPCIERDASPAEALFIAVVENIQRENLTPWEEAQGYAALAEATGWSAREVARRTGRAPKLDQGDEEGVRDVQEKIKVAKTAPRDLIDAHEAGLLTWEQFRGALRTGRMPAPDAPMFPPEAGELRTDAADPAEDDTPSAPAPQPPVEPESTALDRRQRLVMLEICHAARFHPDRLVVDAEDDAVAWAPTGKYWLDMTASSLQTLRFIDFKHHGRPYVRVTTAGLEWMVANDVGELFAALEQARNECGQAAWPGPGYVTDWLNPAPPADAPATPATAPAGDETASIEDAVAATLLEDAWAFADQTAMGKGTPTDPEAWAALLGRTGIAGPYVVQRSDPGLVFDAAGEVAIVVDVDNTLPNDMATARAALIAAALNRVCGHQLEGVS